MNFNDGYFLNNFHKTRFQDMARRNAKIYQSPAYLISAYIFSSSAELASKAEAELYNASINFEHILAQDLKVEQKLLVCFAANFYDDSRYTSPAIADLINHLSGETYTVMLNIFKMFEH
ncbi:MAG: hypothetical protein RR614_08955 [Eubacterium sp.]